MKIPIINQLWVTKQLNAKHKGIENKLKEESQPTGIQIPPSQKWEWKEAKFFTPWPKVSQSKREIEKKMK